MSTDPTRVLVRRSVLNAALIALKNEILGGVGAAYDTLQELKDAYESADESLTTMIGLKVDKTDPRLSDARTPTTHTHPVTDMSATGTRSSATYLRGDNTWETPTNTTYSVMPIAEAQAGTVTTARTMSASTLAQAIRHHVTGSASTAVSAVGQALAKAADAAAARGIIGAVSDSVPTQAEAEAGTATTARAFSAQRVAQAAIAASGKKDWQGTQAQYDALGTKDADRTYWIV